MLKKQNIQPTTDKGNRSRQIDKSWGTKENKFLT